MGDKVVVDTNVPIVANGRDTDAGVECELACVRAINEIQTIGTVVLDESESIMNEYQRYLNYSGEPGVGDSFFRYLFNNQYSSNARIRRVPITASNDDRHGFEELPENELDPSDRKFLAAAVVSGASIVNATDSDWQEQQDLLDRLSVRLIEVCPEVIEERSRRRW